MTESIRDQLDPSQRAPWDTLWRWLLAPRLDDNNGTPARLTGQEDERVSVLGDSNDQHDDNTRVA